MAIYHMSVKAVSRSGGRSATGASAYRAGEKIHDERTGDTHDYSRRSGVVSRDIVLPRDAPDWAQDRAQLWNAAERAEKRKDACVAREIEVSLPEELSPEARRQLALQFAQELAEREGCAVDVAIHSPNAQGDQRNHHAHLLRTTRVMGPEGLGAKLLTEQAGRQRSADLLALRGRWAELTNQHLEQAGLDSRIDARSLEAQGIQRAPQFHLGPAATALERRSGQDSELRQRWQALNNAPEQRQLHKAGQETQERIHELEMRLRAPERAEEPTRRAKTSRSASEPPVRLANLSVPLPPDLQVRLKQREQENARRLAERAAQRRLEEARQQRERLERMEKAQAERERLARVTQETKQRQEEHKAQMEQKQQETQEAYRTPPDSEQDKPELERESRLKAESAPKETRRAKRDFDFEL